MRRRFDLKMTQPRISIEVASKRAFYVSWACRMSFDQIAVEGVCYANEVGQIGGGRRMKRSSERRRCGRQFGHSVRNRRHRLLDAGRLNARNALDCGQVWPIYRLP